MTLSSPSKPAPAMICTPVALPPERQWDAYLTAARINPANAPMFAASADSPILSPLQIAAIATKRWTAGTTITVGWLDGPDAATRRLILSHMKVWSEFANINVEETSVDPMVRVARAPADGYWSYLGTDILSIPRGRATMNLAGFTSRTPDSEYRRVVRHEFGHTLGSPHEQQRAAIIRRLVPAACYRRFGASPNFWPKAIVDQNILTPQDESKLVGSDPEEQSIMCYQFDAELTINGIPILGGTDLTELDKATIAKIYPGRVAIPPPPAPPPAAGLTLVPDGRAIADRISRPGEIDEFPLEITRPGRYEVSTDPALVLAISLIDDDPRTPEIVGVGIMQPAVADLRPGSHRVTVIHKDPGATGQYAVQCKMIK
jgi:hypothetical protein